MLELTLQWTTMWHEIFMGVKFCRLPIFCVLREQIFREFEFQTLSLGTNFCGKASKRCDFICHLGWEKHAINYLLFGRRWSCPQLLSNLLRDRRDDSLCSNCKKEGHNIVFSVQLTEIQ